MAETIDDRARGEFALAIGELADDQDGSKLAGGRELLVRIAVFARAEVERAEQWCIEQQCVLCSLGTSVRMAAEPTWVHYDYEVGGRFDCIASPLREALYQRAREKEQT